MFHCVLTAAAVSLTSAAVFSAAAKQQQYQQQYQQTQQPYQQQYQQQQQQQQYQSEFAGSRRRKSGELYAAGDYEWGGTKKRKRKAAGAVLQLGDQCLLQVFNFF
jgi:mannitol-specific phosphotransferase system IIBC component